MTSTTDVQSTTPCPPWGLSWVTCTPDIHSREHPENRVHYSRLLRLEAIEADSTDVDAYLEQRPGEDEPNVRIDVNSSHCLVFTLTEADRLRAHLEQLISVARA